MADPVGRWSAGEDGAPSELTELLSDARADLPTRAQLAGVEKGLAPLLGPPGGPVPTAPPAGLGALKVAAAVAVGAGLIAAGVWLTAGDETPPASEPQPVSDSAEPTTVERGTPSAVPNSEPSAASVEATPSATKVAPEPTRTHAAAPKSVTHKKPSEADLLNRAQAALKTDPKHALALTRQHKRLYPNGALSQEREVIAIEALSLLHKKTDAEKRADRFGKKYPESAHQEKVRTTVDDD